MPLFTGVRGGRLVPSGRADGGRHLPVLVRAVGGAPRPLTHRRRLLAAEDAESCEENAHTNIH